MSNDVDVKEFAINVANLIEGVNSKLQKQSLRMMQLDNLLRLNLAISSLVLFALALIVLFE